MLRVLSVLRVLRVRAGLRGSVRTGPSVLLAVLATITVAPGVLSQSPSARTVDPGVLAPVFSRAAELPKLRSLVIAQDGRIIGERYYHGATRTRTANVKSVSKSIIAALVGIAIAEGKLDSVRQRIGEFFPRDLREPEHAAKRDPGRSALHASRARVDELRWLRTLGDERELGALSAPAAGGGRAR